MNLQIVMVTCQSNIVQVPFEITACNVIIHYWSDVVPAGGIIAIVIVLYA
jgi:amino acid transporter